MPFYSMATFKHVIRSTFYQVVDLTGQHWMFKNKWILFDPTIGADCTLQHTPSCSSVKTGRDTLKKIVVLDPTQSMQIPCIKLKVGKPDTAVPEIKPMTIE